MRRLLAVVMMLPVAAFAKPKVALYMDHGCRGVGAVRRAEVIATFDCDGKPEHDAKSPMRGKPAAIWAEYGRGRIFAFAVHPESWDRNHDLVRGAFRAVLGIEPAFPER